MPRAASQNSCFAVSFKRADSTLCTICAPQKLQAGQTWFLVEAGWLKHWREYCWDATRSDPPGPVRGRARASSHARCRGCSQLTASLAHT